MKPPPLLSKVTEKLTDKSNHEPTPHLADILGHQPNRGAHLPCNANRQLRIQIRLLVGPARRHELVVHIATLHAVQHIEQEHAGANGLIFKGANAGVAPAFPALLVGPLDHLVVGDLAFPEPLRERGERLGDVAAHELPHEAERERALAVGDVGALDADEGEAHLFAELDGVVCVFDGFEAHELGARGGTLVHVPPVDAAGDDLVVGLQEDGAVAEVVEEGYDGGLDVQGVEPESEDAGFALAFGVEVFDLRFFFFGDGIEARVGVEKVGNKGEVELGVTGDKGCGGEEFTAFKFVGVVKNLLRSLKQIPGLKR